jgi:hypothetical protein
MFGSVRTHCPGHVTPHRVGFSHSICSYQPDCRRVGWPTPTGRPSRRSPRLSAFAFSELMRRDHRHLETTTEQPHSQGGNRPSCG